MNFQDIHRLSREILNELQCWFPQYVQSFCLSDPALRQLIKLKEDHTLRVCKQILDIGRKLALSENDLRIAEVIALFHDIGRFEQIAHYQTFVDGKSEDHANLSVKVLQRENALVALDEKTKQLIMRAISNHNRLSIPENESPDCLFYSRLLRDADKLDILELFSTCFYVACEERSSIVQMDLPDLPGASQNVLDELEQGNKVSTRQLKCINDYKLFQMGWVYDINFQPTFQIIHGKGYLRMIRDALPVSEKIDKAYERLISYVEGRI